MATFDHERLDVYKAVIEFLALADGIVEGLPRGRAHGFGVRSSDRPHAAWTAACARWLSQQGFLPGQAGK